MHAQTRARAKNASARAPPRLRPFIPPVAPSLPPYAAGMAAALANSPGLAERMARNPARFAEDLTFDDDDMVLVAPSVVIPKLQPPTAPIPHPNAGPWEMACLEACWEMARANPRPVHVCCQSPLPLPDDDDDAEDRSTQPLTQVAVAGLLSMGGDPRSPSQLSFSDDEDDPELSMINPFARDNHDQFEFDNIVESLHTSPILSQEFLEAVRSQMPRSPPPLPTHLADIAVELEPEPEPFADLTGMFATVDQNAPIRSVIAEINELRLDALRLDAEDPAEEFEAQIGQLLHKWGLDHPSWLGFLNNLVSRDRYEKVTLEYLLFVELQTEFSEDTMIRDLINYFDECHDACIAPTTLRSSASNSSSVYWSGSAIIRASSPGSRIIAARMPAMKVLEGTVVVVVASVLSSSPLTALSVSLDAVRNALSSSCVVGYLLIVQIVWSNLLVVHLNRPTSSDSVEDGRADWTRSGAVHDSGGGRYERYAKNNLPRNAHDYYASGSNDMITLRENRAAYSRLRLMPRILVDVSDISTKTSVLGVNIDSPICVAPTAMQKMAHPDGEVGTSKAAAAHNTLMCLSSWSTTALEEVASAAPAGFRFFQLYVYKDRAVTLDLIKRAEAAGYKALAIT
ncbi:FMN-dependent dehydrogenase-domain-containing protein, partial [Ochromonadaceae sp. CCMP2298]